MRARGRTRDIKTNYALICPLPSPEKIKQPLRKSYYSTPCMSRKRSEKMVTAESREQSSHIPFLLSPSWYPPTSKDSGSIVYILLKLLSICPSCQFNAIGILFSLISFWLGGRHTFFCVHLLLVGTVHLVYCILISGHYFACYVCDDIIIVIV